MSRKYLIGFLIAAFLVLTPTSKATAQDTTEEPTVEDLDGDIYGEASYKQFVSTCRDKVDRKNFWIFSNEEKRSICSDELIADNSIWSSFINSKTYGRYPTHNYQIVSDDGRFYNALRQIKDFLTSFIFSLVLLLTAIATVLLEFAYEFKIISWLGETFGELSDQYLGGLGHGTNNSLYILALFLTTFVAGIYALRGRMAKAGSEMLGAYTTAFTLALIVALGGFLNPILGLLGTTLDISDELTGTVLEPHEQCQTLSETSTKYSDFFAENLVAKELIERGSLDTETLTTNTPETSEEEIDQLVNRDNSTSVCTAAMTLQESFVAEPYDYIQWGADLDTKAYANCAIARDVILSKNWTSNDPEPRFLMRHAGDECKQFAEFNHDPSMERMSMAFISLLVTLIGLAIVFWALIHLLIAQLKLMFVIATGAWAFLSGMAPSGMRGGFYGWVNALIKSLLDLIAISLFLAFYLSVYSSISGSQHIEWSAKSILLSLTSVAFFVAKKKAKTKSKMLADKATNVIAKTPAIEPESIRTLNTIQREGARQAAKLPQKMMTKPTNGRLNLPHKSKFDKGPKDKK